MTHEILFRGKAEPSGKWIYGDLMYYAGGAQIWEQEENGKWNTIVDYDTVGQYTGLTDRNGVKIFEGDIVSVDGKDGLARISWDGYAAMFIVEWDGLTSDFDNIGFHEVEVVGNIHDNPELLEGGTEG